MLRPVEGDAQAWNQAEGQPVVEQDVLQAVTTEIGTKCLMKGAKESLSPRTSLQATLIQHQQTPLSAEELASAIECYLETKKKLNYQEVSKKIEKYLRQLKESNNIISQSLISLARLCTNFDVLTRG